MRRRILLMVILLCTSSLAITFSQSKLVFTSTYLDRYHKPDSILIEDLNTGSTVLKHYPDTVLKLLITGDNTIPGEKSIIINQNYPNPFADNTNIEIDLPESGPVTLIVSDLSGRLIASASNNLPAGLHSFLFTGGSRQLYFATVQTRFKRASIKMMCMGQSSSSDPGLVYNGGIHTVRSSKAAAIHFDFNTGDNIRCIGFMTDSAGSVVRDTIFDSPTISKTYTFNFQRKNRIVILMYHKITEGLSTNEYERSAADFENDLKYLAGNNFEVIPMEDLPLLASGEKKLNSNAAIITFDDGYESNYTLAAPLLTKYSMPATFFLITEMMDSTEYIKWSQVWVMSQVEWADGSHPFVMGSHTSSHPFLAQSIQYFPDHADYMNFLNTELGDSKNWITDITSQENIYISLPFGDGAGNADIISVAKACGYSGIRTSIWDSLDPEKMNIWMLPSVPILGADPFNVIELYFRY
jgi:peptidoglycan/xylan/chitin deacetylase (PgdA/CDA1 family)